LIDLSVLGGGFEFWNLIAIPFGSEALSHLQSIQRNKRYLSHDDDDEPTKLKELVEWS
jgi:hypothetical protein